jgi:hypothetical protein
MFISKIGNGYQQKTCGFSQEAQWMMGIQPSKHAKTAPGQNLVRMFVHLFMVNRVKENIPEGISRFASESHGICSCESD